MTLANTHTKLAAGGDFTIVYMGGLHHPGGHHAA